MRFMWAYTLTLAVPTLPVRLQTSTIGAVSLTSVFGMGTGVTLQLSPPGNFLKSFQICAGITNSYPANIETFVMYS